VNGPVAGTWVAGLGPEDWHRPVHIRGDHCPAYDLQPGKPRLLVVHDPKGKRFGTLRLKGDEKGPLTVKLGPAGAVKGRVVDADGKPLAGVTVRLYLRERPAEEIHDHAHRDRPVETDADGKFVIDEVVPGVKFGLLFSRGKRTFRPADRLEKPAPAGKALDLGDVKVKAE
jgi:hypothetical protein